MQFDNNNRYGNPSCFPSAHMPAGLLLTNHMGNVLFLVAQNY